MKRVDIFANKAPKTTWANVWLNIWVGVFDPVALSISLNVWRPVAISTK